MRIDLTVQYQCGCTETVAGMVFEMAENSEDESR
jgi:hypothetical protein